MPLLAIQAMSFVGGRFGFAPDNGRDAHVPGNRCHQSLLNLSPSVNMWRDNHELFLRRSDEAKEHWSELLIYQQVQGAHASIPPSRIIVCPVIQAAAGETRKAASSPTSRSVPKRRAGISASARSRIRGSARRLAVISVSR